MYSLRLWQLFEHLTDLEAMTCCFKVSNSGFPYLTCYRSSRFTGSRLYRNGHPF